MKWKKKKVIALSYFFPPICQINKHKMRLKQVGFQRTSPHDWTFSCHPSVGVCISFPAVLSFLAAKQLTVCSMHLQKQIFKQAAQRKAVECVCVCLRRGWSLQVDRWDADSDAVERSWYWAVLRRIRTGTIWGKTGGEWKRTLEFRASQPLT